MHRYYSINIVLLLLLILRSTSAAVENSPGNTATGVPFNQYAESVHSFLSYIQEEYMRIETTLPGRWAQLNVQELVELHNCSTLVASIVQFIGWSDCDITEACTVLQTANFTLSTTPILTTEQTTIAKNYNTTSITIPYLHYTNKLN